MRPTVDHLRIRKLTNSRFTLKIPIVIKCQGRSRDFRVETGSRQKYRGGPLSNKVSALGSPENIRMRGHTLSSTTNSFTVVRIQFGIKC